MSDSSDSTDPRPSLQSEAQRLAEAARERAADAFEEIKVSSNQLVDKVRELIEEGNVRRIALRKGDRTLFEIPLTVGAGAAAAAVLFNPLLAGIGAVAALVSDITLVVERADEADGDASADTASAGAKASGAQASGAQASSAQAGDSKIDAPTSGTPTSGAPPAGSDAGKTMGRTSGDGGDTEGDDAA